MKEAEYVPSTKTVQEIMKDIRNLITPDFEKVFEGAPPSKSFDFKNHPHFQALKKTIEKEYDLSGLYACIWNDNGQWFPLFWYSHTEMPSSPQGATAMFSLHNARVL